MKYTVASVRNGVWGDEPAGDGSDVRCIRAADFDRVHLRACVDSAPFRQVPSAQLPAHVLQRGDLVLEKSGGGDTQPVGLVVLFNGGEPAVCSNFAARIRTAEGFDSRYLCYLHAHLYSAGINTKSIKQNTGIQNLDAHAYFDELVYVAPLEEQRNLTDFLDRETEKIDALVAKKRRLIEVLHEKRTALISHAVTNGLDPDVPRNDSGIEWLAELPVGWQGLSLKRCVATPITDGPHETPEFADDGVPFLSADAVQGGILDFVRKRGCINRDLHEQYSRKCRPRRGDILLCKSGATTGKLALVQTDIAFSVWSPLALIRADENVVRIEFLVIALESEYVQNQIRRTWSEGTQANISMAALGRLFVAVPPVEVQDRIVGMIRDQTATSTPVVDRIEDCLDKLLEYRSALITAAVTGQIDVRTYRREAS